MEIREFNEDWEETIGTTDVESIKADGITVRTGNRVIRMQVVEDTTIPEDDIKKELEEKFREELVRMRDSFETYKSSMKETLAMHRGRFKEKEALLQVELSRINKLPNINDSHADQGLSVVNNNNTRDGGLVWYFKCVYNPKYVNGTQIDPAWAKRIMTPVTIVMKTNSENQVTQVKIVKIIGHQKFMHYHSMSQSSDCWGDWRVSGKVVETPEDAIKVFKDALMVLETINEFSLGDRTPTGLSKFDTIKKHLVQDGEVAADSRTAINSRNNRSGFDTDVNDDVAADVWSTLG
jgi:hypothetical protein